MTEALRLSRRNGVLEIVLDRPKANAIDSATSRQMGEAFVALRDDDTLRCAIITGGGERIFSAGWDLKAAAELGENESSDYGIGGFAGLDILLDLNKPVIAAVNGIAVGGGVEIALACDLVVAAEHAEFRLPETSLGVMADAGGVQRLPRRIPRNVALEMLLTGRALTAAEAAHWGLVNRVVPAQTLMAHAHELAAAIVAGAPLAVAAIKESVRAMDCLSEREALMLTRAQHLPIYRQMLESEDHLEGPRAFAEKRPPAWKGR